MSDLEAGILQAMLRKARTMKLTQLEAEIKEYAKYAKVDLEAAPVPAEGDE